MIGSTRLRLDGACATLPRPIFGCLLGLWIAAWTGPGLLAQGPAKIDREMTFVRGLARELGLVSLAESELGRLEQTFKTAGDQDKILQLRVEVSLFGARIKPNRVDQRADYKKALDQSKELLERSNDAALQRDARATLAEAAQEFGQFLNEEIDIARTEAPDTVKGLEGEAKDVFVLGVEACDKVMLTLSTDKEKSPEKRLEYGLTWMRKGVLLREHARAVKDDRAHLVEKSIGELEEMVLFIGEETALGLRGLFEIAQCHEVAGDTATAVDSYRSTIEQIGVTLNDEHSGLSGETASFLFDMMQEVYAHLGDLLFQTGDPAAAQALFTSFRENLGKFGEKGLKPLDVCDPRFGHLTFLAECRFLAESGDPKKVQEALDTAQYINEKHPSDYVGVKAKATLREILAAKSDLASGALLFEIAKGAYQDKNYEDAVKGLRVAIAAMTADEKKTLALDAYDHLGKCFAATDRYLESVVAFQRGLQLYGKGPDGNEAANASDIADRLDRALTAIKSISKNDPALKFVFEGAEPMVLAYSTGGAGKVHWKNGNDRFTDRKFAEAAAAYEQVPVEFLQYEQARARLVKAHVAAGAFDKARAAIAAYRSWLQTKEAVLDPKRSDKAQVREFAIREIAYTEASMAYVEAYGEPTLGIKKDPAKYPEAIRMMQAFVSNYGKSKEGSIAQALDALGHMHADMGDLDKAESAYLQVKDLDEDRASRLASVIFSAYLAHAGNLAKELDGAVSGNQDKATVDKITTDLQGVRTRLCSLGVEYMRSSQKPQLGILVNTMNGFERLGDWKKVDEVAQRALQLYGDATDKNTKDIIDLTVRPTIGEALLEQRQFQQAYDMLIAAEQANPSLYPVKRLICRALGGWFYLNATGRGVKEPGLGRFKEAYDKYYSEYRTWATRPEVKPYSLEWYTFQWECYWFARQAGEKDSAYKKYADTIFKTTGAFDSFAALKNLGVDGKLLFTYFDLNR